MRKTIQELEAENTKLYKDNCNLRLLMKQVLELVPENNRLYCCMGCGHEPDEEHKADCVYNTHVP